MTLALLWTLCFVSITASADEGLLTLALLNKRFPVKKAAEIVSVSRRPAMGFLYKSFGGHFENLQEFIDTILSPSINPHYSLSVVVYGDCGPCRYPRRPKGQFPLIAPKETISSLNRKLEKNEHSIVKQFRVSWTALETRLPKVEGVKYVFIPSLEDNLSDRAYLRLFSVAKGVFGLRSDIRFGRNPVSASGIAKGAFEVHSYAIKAPLRLRRGDIITGDGDTLCYPEERGCRGHSVAQVRQWVETSRERNLISLIYRPELQGLSRNPQSVLVPPTRRTYRLVGANYLKYLIQ